MTRSGFRHRERLLCHGAGALVFIALLVAAPRFQSALAMDDSPYASSLATLNRSFLSHLDGLSDEHAVAVAAVREAWRSTYRDGPAASFVTDALSQLYPDYAAALAAFDADQLLKALADFEALRSSSDSFLAADATYFTVRTLVALGRYEDAETAIGALDLDDLAAHTAYADNLRFIQAACQARNLRTNEAIQTLHSLDASIAATPEAVRNGAAQLRLELDRREQGTLGEVAVVMDYVADHLNADDGTDRVQQRQEQVLAMIDKLIDDAEQREGKGGGASQAQNRGGQQPRGAQPNAPPEESTAPDSQSQQMGDLHAAPRVDPGEMWGKLPPAEREKVLQSIRERYPSRYRQLVEQYYRALAEEK